MAQGDEKPIERLIRELLHRERLANTVAVDAARSLDDLFARIADAILANDPTAVSRTRYRRERVEKVLAEVQRIVRDYAPELESRLKDHLAAIGRQQAKQAEGALIATLGSPASQAVRSTPITQQRMRAILNTDPFRGKTLKEHTQRLSANVYDRTLTQIRLGMSNEESIGDIVRRVRGKQAGYIRRGPDGQFVPKGTKAASVRPRFTGGALSTTTQDAEALVRTAVNHVSNVGMMDTFRANPEVLDGVRYVATLDDRTTEICLRYDGEVWPLDSGEIQTPPLHFNCRSILVPEVAYERLGLEPPPEADRFARDLSDVSDEDLARKVSARRRTGDFGGVQRVPSSRRAEQWLRDQRVSVQEKILGAEKARRFRAGDITLRDIVRDDNTIVPLFELAGEN